jgi:LemA protein
MKAIGCIGAAILAVLVVALVVGGMYVSHKNQMVTLNETVKSNWAQVDVVLQRRADLIPNLVSTVKGYATHEEKVFDDIAQARAALIGAKTPSDTIAANGALDSALSRLLVLKEAYPDLKANQNFLQLQDELAGTENRIAVERKRYNDSIQAYNTYIGMFPNSVFAKWAGYARNDAYFAADATSKEVPKVQF